jgi:hypothetical protein
VDPDAVVVQLTTTAKESRLVAEIPIPGSKRRQIE